MELNPMGETYMVRECYEKCLGSIDDSMDNEQAIKVLKAYGTKVDGYIEKYIRGRSLPGKYSRKVHEELSELAGYLMEGLPDLIREGIVVVKGGGILIETIEEALRGFGERNISEETWSHPMRSPPDTLEDKSLEEALA
jgi:hypothetical protein